MSLSLALAVAGAAIAPSLLRARGGAVAAGATPSSAPQNGHGADVRIAVVAPLEEESMLGPSWGEALPHLAQRMAWTDEGLHMATVAADVSINPAQLGGMDIVVAVGVRDPATAAAVADAVAAAGARHFVALDCAPALSGGSFIARAAVAPEDPAKLSGLRAAAAAVAAALSPSARASQRAAHAVALMHELYARATSDDLLFSLLVLVDVAARPVAAVANSAKSADAGPDAVACMVSNCGAEMFRCFALDPTCRAALSCMNGCPFGDQVCTYRCIASYESPGLQAFSLCIIQKHNCLGLSAEIPAEPNPPPMTAWRGAPLTQQIAESLFVGWLDGPSAAPAAPPGLPGPLDPFSWRVFAGKNPAYDYFPCQYQIFYPGKARGSFWYQPVFKVLTIDGRSEWRRRLYRVRRDATPGAFTLSVLDNGVTSLERWSILDCDDALEWCVFYYRGAASAAGMSYTGAVLGSRSGGWPAGAEAVGRIEAALERAGIKMWELSDVKNGECGGAPLELIGPTVA